MDQFAAHLDRGWDLVQRGDFAGAMLSAKKSLELDAESPEAHNLIGYIHAIEGNAEEALEHYQQAIELDETFFEAMLNATEVMIHPLRDLEGALVMVENALDYAADDDEVADALLLKIDALLHKGEMEEAKRAVALLPAGPFEHAHVEFLIGRAKFEVGDVDGAEPRIRAAVEREPGNAEAQYYLGLVLEARNDLRGATVAFLVSRDLDLRMGAAPWALTPEQFELRVQAAIRRIDAGLVEALEGALVVVGDMPGAEVVAEGVDPRIVVLLDDLSPKESAARAGRVFVYQRNVERVATTASEMEEEVAAALERELMAAFPELERRGTRVDEGADERADERADEGADEGDRQGQGGDGGKGDGGGSSGGESGSETN